MALLYSHKCRPKFKETLSRDMEELADFLQTWKLKLTTTKTTSTLFRLNNHEAQRQPNICVHWNTLPHNPHPKYFGEKLDRQLTYRQHIEVYVYKWWQKTTSSDACLGQLGVQMLKSSEQHPLQLFTAAQNMPLQYGAKATIPKSYTYPWIIPWGS